MDRCGILPYPAATLNTELQDPRTFTAMEFRLDHDVVIGISHTGSIHVDNFSECVTRLGEGKVCSSAPSRVFFVETVEGLHYDYAENFHDMLLSGKDPLSAFICLAAVAYLTSRSDCIVAIEAVELSDGSRSLAKPDYLSVTDLASLADSISKAAKIAPTIVATIGMAWLSIGSAQFSKSALIEDAVASIECDEEFIQHGAYNWVEVLVAHLASFADACWAQSIVSSYDSSYVWLLSPLVLHRMPMAPVGVTELYSTLEPLSALADEGEKFAYFSSLCYEAISLACYRARENPGRWNQLTKVDAHKDNYQILELFGHLSAFLIGISSRCKSMEKYEARILRMVPNSESESEVTHAGVRFYQDMQDENPTMTIPVVSALKSIISAVSLLGLIPQDAVDQIVLSLYETPFAPDTRRSRWVGLDQTLAETLTDSLPENRDAGGRGAQK